MNSASSWFLGATSRESALSNWESRLEVESPADCFGSGRHLIYTVIVGDYDSLKRPLWRPRNVDYIAFVSEPAVMQSRGWELSQLPKDTSGPKLLNRRMKILGVGLEDKYDSVIYVDGSIQIIGSLEHLIARFLDSGDALGLFRHEERTNPWAELIACKELGYLSEIEIGIEEARLGPFEKEQIALSLFDAGVILRNPGHEAISEISKRWFQLFMQNPVRDQLSLPIVVWENEGRVFQFEHWRKSYTSTFLRYPHNTGGRVIKSVFLLGSSFPRLFQKLVVFSRRRQGLSPQKLMADG